MSDQPSMTLPEDAARKRRSSRADGSAVSSETKIAVAAALSEVFEQCLRVRKEDAAVAVSSGKKKANAKRRLKRAESAAPHWAREWLAHLANDKLSNSGA